MEKRIFYSWQSDLPNNTNRGFIDNAIQKAIDQINSDDSYSLIPFLDRDTKGLTGSPDISGSIFNKIDNSSVFICDVSIINGDSADSRPTPNPNVLVELGYSVSRLGWDKIILIMNEEYGNVEKLPFDLRGRKVLTYLIASGSQSKAPERKKVASILKNGISEILDAIENQVFEQKRENSIGNLINKNVKVDQESKAMLGAVKAITNFRKKNESAIKLTDKYIDLKRLDLAVGFALEITNTRKLNTFLIQIAKDCIEHGDLTTAQRAITGITNMRERNQLSMRVIELSD